MGATRGPHDQLDVPLVWDRTPSGPQTPPPEPRRPAAPPRPRWSRARLWVATLADLGVVLLSLAATWGVAATLGASLYPPQLAAAGLAGLLLAAVLGVGAFWGWRASPGMALLRLRFAAPLSLGTAAKVWLGWLFFLLLAGIPLLLGRRGRTLAEVMAGSEITLHSPPGTA
jgi:hypothetical protein